MPYIVKHDPEGYHLIPDQDLDTICKPGTADCCIFLVCGAKGFECAKFTPMARTIMVRHMEGTMRATRVGDCRLEEGGGQA